MLSIYLRSLLAAVTLIMSVSEYADCQAALADTSAAVLTPVKVQRFAPPQRTYDIVKNENRALLPTGYVPDRMVNSRAAVLDEPQERGRLAEAIGLGALFGGIAGLVLSYTDVIGDDYGGPGANAVVFAGIGAFGGFVYYIARHKR